jgi:GNAT superfamily N-acetyltransferase
MEIRNAGLGDAAAAAELLRRSITELCVADHRNDPAILAPWLRNKTPESLAAWIERPSNSVLVAVRTTTLLGIGIVTDQGEITLNYVSPDARFQGVTRALLAAMEARALARGNVAVALTSTVTARRFYLSAGYLDDPTRTDANGAPMLSRRL